MSNTTNSTGGSSTGNNNANFTNIDGLPLGNRSPPRGGHGSNMGNNQNVQN